MNLPAIAFNTFREAVRDRVLYLLLVFAVVVIATGKALGWVSMGEDVKVMRDVGLGAISVFGVLVSVFLGTSLVRKEIDKRTIYTILAKPVARWQFIVGKYLGLVATTYVNLLLMSLLFLVYLKVLAPEATALSKAMAQAIVFIFVELAVMNAFAVMFSVLSTPILSAVFTVLVFFVGRMAGSVAMLADFLKPLPGGTGSAFGYHLFRVLHTVLPNLDLLDMRNRAAHWSPEVDLSIGGAQFVWTIVYALSYTAAVVLLSVGVFERKRL